MESKEDMELYHKMPDGECIITESLEETIEINEKYIAFLEKQIKMIKELLESIKNFINRNF